MAEITIRGRRIGPDQPPFIIAEAGINHNGELDKAIAMVRVASEAGADAVKFQAFKSGQICRRSDPLADNQRGNIAIVIGADAGIDAERVDDGLRGRLAEVLRGLINDGDRLAAMGVCGAARVVGRGKECIVSALADT
jgi:hypothetical protein